MRPVGDRAAKDALYEGFAEVAKALSSGRRAEIASERVAELWAALRDVAVDHVAGIERLAGAYLGERDGIDVIDHQELAARLKRHEVLVLDIRPEAEHA